MDGRRELSITTQIIVHEAVDRNSQSAGAPLNGKSIPHIAIVPAAGSHILIISDPMDLPLIPTATPIDAMGIIIRKDRAVRSHPAASGHMIVLRRGHIVKTGHMVSRAMVEDPLAAMNRTAEEHRPAIMAPPTPRGEIITGRAGHGNHASDSTKVITSDLAAMMIRLAKNARAIASVAVRMATVLSSHQRENVM